MIQRIQSLLLGLVALFYVLLYFVPVFIWEGNSVKQVPDPKNLIIHQHTIFSIVIGSIILFSLFIITQFKNRRKQRTFVFVLMIIMILNICLCLFYATKVTVANEYVLVWVKSYGMYLQLISLLLCYFAARRIKKDDDLVKSVDRIR